MKYTNITLLTFLLILQQTLVLSCLITNCPRGGKRNGKLNLAEANIKQCVACGPGRSGQCFGPNICCGPYGCLIGTPETVVCKREGFFQDLEPCIAGTMPCRRNTGRCATDGVCCNQDSCHVDKFCTSPEEKLLRSPLEFYNLEYSAD